MEKTLKKGSRGDDVRELQSNLNKLGYDVKNDGIFGDDTEKAVLNLQNSFGYTVDGVVGKGTHFLVTQQIGLGWNAKNPEAAAKGGAPATTAGDKSAPVVAGAKAAMSPDAKKLA